VARLRSVIDACIRFRLLVIALAAGIMVLGILQLSRMPVDVLPETSPVTVDIQTEALGLSAPEVESLVTVPLEKNLLEGVLGVTDVTSDSIEGLSDIELHFAPGTGLYHARQLVQERLTGAFVLPNVSKPPVMLQPTSTTSNVMLVGLSSAKLSAIDMSVLARWTIVPRLLGLPGVANVSTFGQADRQLQVLVNPSELAARHVTLDQVIQTAGDAQLVSPLSYLQASTPGTGGFLEGPQQRVTIQPVLPFGTPKNMAELPVAGAPADLRLGDIATMVQGNPPLTGSGQGNGAPALVLGVQKSPSANVLAVSSEVDAAIASLKPGLPGLTFNASLFREDTYLRSSLSNLRTALIIAGILMAVALLALLLALRMAFAALCGVAVSYVAATALLSVFGYTFNALVTLGLLLALGFVVTEAAGSARAITARRRARSDAAGPGNSTGTSRVADLVGVACGELRGSLAGAGIAALACAVPLLIATGLTATFLRPMALAFALAIAISMVIAVTVTPALAAFLLAVAPEGALAGRGGGLAAVPGRIGAGYARAMDRLTAAPRLAAAVLGLALVAGIAAVAALPFVHAGQPSFHDRSLVMRLTGPPGMSLTEMDRMTALVTSELRAVPSVASVGATLGRATTSDQVENTNTGELWVTLKPDASYNEAVGAVRGIATGTPGVTGTVSTYETDSMTGVLGSPASTVVTRIYGLDFGELGKLANSLRGVIASIPGVTDASETPPVTQPTIDLTVNLVAAARVGVSPGDVRREAGTLLSGLTVGNYFENQEVFDVVVWGTPATRDSLTSVQNLLIDTANGGHVRLGQVASISVRPQPSDIPQEAMSRYVDVTAAVSGGSAGSVSAAIGKKVESMSFPMEYHAELAVPTEAGTALAGTAAGNALSPNGAAVAGTSRFAFVGYVIAALVAILLIAQAVTGSWRLAFLAFLALPMSLSGAVLVTFAADASGTLAAAAGLLAAFALAARLVIGTAARLRAPRAGQARPEDPGAAGGPMDILVPASVTAVALIPFVVIGDVPGMELLHTAAAVILGGLATTAAVSVVALPVAARILGPKGSVDYAGVAGEVAVPAARQPVDAAARPPAGPGADWAGSVEGTGAKTASVRNLGEEQFREDA
jgi:Cu/Ag efflux pump CusA